MPVTAPTSSAMVTTRIARLMLTFQLVKMLGAIAGSISLMKYCSVVGRNERIMWRNSRGTPRIASSVSIRNTGPQTTTSTKPMRNSTPGNQSNATITRASVTTMSTGVMVAKLFAILTTLGMANGGIPSTGARCDSTSQQTTKTSSDTRVWRGNFRSRTESRCTSWDVSWDIDDLLVRHGLVEAGLHGPLHHVGDRLAGGRLP